jgi:hypothetical protein
MSSHHTPTTTGGPIKHQLASSLHHKRLSNSTGAIAGFASAISVIVGTFAALFAPHGWLRVGVALHMHRQPLIIRLAPYIAAIAITIATVAGLLRFYSWLRERAEQRPQPEQT